MEMSLLMIILNKQMIVDNMIRILISIIGVMLISLNISAQKLPTDVKDKKWNSTLSSLVNNYNQKNCPKDLEK